MKTIFALGKRLLTKAPVVGDLIENHASKDGGENKMHWPKAFSMVVRYIIIGIIVFYSTKAVLEDKKVDKEEIKILKDNIELLEGLE